MTTTITEKTIEKEFLTWAEPVLHTIDTTCVWAAASSFLANRHPEYRTTKTTGQLVRAFIEMRNGVFLPNGTKREVAELQEVLLSLTAHVNKH